MDVNKISNIVKDDEIVFMTYVGFMTQTLLTGMIDSLTHDEEFSDIPNSVAHNIFTVFIEMIQNIIKYSKSELISEKSYKSNGMIAVGKNENNIYYIVSKNIVNKQDVKVIMQRIDYINNICYEEIKEKYRELRRSGINSHERGAGIGFYEIAKRAKKMKYEFEKINSEKYYFYLKVEIRD